MRPQGLYLVGENPLYAREFFYARVRLRRCSQTTSRVGPTLLSPPPPLDLFRFSSPLSRSLALPRPSAAAQPLVSPRGWPLRRAASPPSAIPERRHALTAGLSHTPSLSHSLSLPPSLSLWIGSLGESLGKFQWNFFV